MKNTKLILFIAILAIGWLVRFLYYSNNNLYVFYPDTYQYFNRAVEINRGQSLIHPYRTPLYPLLLNYLFHPQKEAAYREDLSQTNFNQLLDLQSQFDVISFFLYLFIAYKLFPKKWQFGLAGIMLAFNIHVFAIGRNLLTEPLSVFLILIMASLLLVAIELKNLYWLLAAQIISILLFLLRPVFLYLPICLFPIIIYLFISYKKKSKMFLAIFITIIPLLVTLFYIIRNSQINGFTGITTISNQNLFAKVIQYHLDTKSINFSSPYLPDIESCLEKHKNDEWVNIDDCQNLGIGGDPNFIKSSPILGSFAIKAILKQPLKYIFSSIVLIPEALVGFVEKPFGFINLYSEMPVLKSIWNMFYQLYIYLTRFLLGFFLFYPLSIYFFFKKPAALNTFLFIMGNIIFGQLFFNVFFVQSEYARLREPIDPLLWLFCLNYYYVILKKVNRFIHSYANKNKKNT